MENRSFAQNKSISWSSQAKKNFPKGYLIVIRTFLLVCPFLVLAPSSSLADAKCTPFSKSIFNEKFPKNAGEVTRLAEENCSEGSKIYVDEVPNSWVPDVIYNLCNLKYSLHVERLGKRPARERGQPELGRAGMSEIAQDFEASSIICIFEGKR